MDKDILTERKGNSIVKHFSSGALVREILVSPKLNIHRFTDITYPMEQGICVCYFVPYGKLTSGEGISVKRAVSIAQVIMVVKMDVVVDVWHLLPPQACFLTHYLQAHQ